MEPQEQWTAVDRYLTDRLAPSRTDPRRRAQTPARPPDCPPSRSRRTRARCSLCSPARAGARRILEIGTLGGYSTLWLARGLPPDGSGRIVTLEFEPRHAEVARANFARAGLTADVIDVRVGPRAGNAARRLQGTVVRLRLSSMPTRTITPATSTGRCGWRGRVP